MIDGKGLECAAILVKRGRTPLQPARSLKMEGEGEAAVGHGTWSARRQMLRLGGVALVVLVMNLPFG